MKKVLIIFTALLTACNVFAANPPSKDQSLQTAWEKRPFSDLSEPYLSESESSSSSTLSESEDKPFSDPSDEVAYQEFYKELRERKELQDAARRKESQPLYEQFLKGKK